LLILLLLNFALGTLDYSFLKNRKERYKRDHQQNVQSVNAITYDSRYEDDDASFDACTHLLKIVLHSDCSS